MAEQKCNLTKEYKDIKCEEQRCSLPDSKNSKTDPSKLGFWFQDDFNVTSENIGDLKGPNLTKYTCITKDAKNGLEVGGVCIKNQTVAKKPSDYLLQNPFVIDFLSMNLTSFSYLPIVVAKKVDFNNIPQGLSVYNLYGKKVLSVVGEDNDLFVLPSLLRVTRETVSWMVYDQILSLAICNTLGIRKLDSEETEALPNENYLGCFYNESARPLNQATSNVWAVGEYAATSQSPSEIKYGAEQFVFKHLQVIFSQNQLEVPEGWVEIAENIYIFKRFSPAINLHSFEKFESVLKSEIFKNFLKQDGAYVFINLATDFSGDLTKFNYFNIGETYLFCNRELIQNSSLKPLREFLNTLHGKTFFFHFVDIPKEPTDTGISKPECEDFISNRIDKSQIECGEGWVKRN